MSERADVVVVGGGVMGLASAWALRRAGREPVVLEQFTVGNTRASSYGASRIFRLAYEEQEWVRLAQEAFPLWREAEREAGEPLLELNGLLDLADDPSRLVAALEACGTEFELLTAAETQHRFGLATDCCKAVFQPDAGVVLADRALAAFRRGVDVREGVRVTALVPGTEGVRIETEAGDLQAELVVVAAGGWSRSLLAGTGIDLAVRPTRETVAYFRLADERAVPSVIDYRNRETYSLAAGPGLLKVGVHRSGPTTDPDEPGVADPEIVRFAADWAARIFRLADPEPVSVETCIYTNTADTRFVIERHGPIVVCSACSGHGFKFAPAVGRKVAQLAT
ncbi:MAG TPA: FAD-dependent oxidoreductase [Gaiellaceae bacterium]|nr:FAD-dependent oxidoreductase [Gaiellaceae bacterium]